MTWVHSFISLFLITLTVDIYSQTLITESIELAGDRINIVYTLNDGNTENEYKVDLYSSIDNFAIPLSKVSGEVGTEVSPGSLKKIQWRILEEIGAYEGDLAIEIRARVYIPFVKLSGFELGTNFKRGRTYPLLWSSGNMGGQLDIELYKEQNRIEGDRNVPNSGKYEYAIPGSVKPGKDYRLKFTNTRNRDEFVYSNVFRIKPRLPFIIKLGTALVLSAGVTYAIINQNEGSGPVEEAEILESHPGFPEN